MTEDALSAQRRQRAQIHANLDAPAGDSEQPIVRDEWGGGDIQATADLDAETITALEAIERDGFAILNNVISEAEADAVRREMDAIEQPKGRNRFEGFNTKRINSVYGKTSAVDFLIEHPRVLKVLDRLLQPNFLLSACQCIEILPGEKAQPFHFDCAYIRVPRPRRHVLGKLGTRLLFKVLKIATSSDLPDYLFPTQLPVNVFFAIDAFTKSNGATHMIPGSHKWPSNRYPDPTKDTILQAEMPKGSALVFVSTIWHAGGANKSDKPRMALAALYGEPYVRTLENVYGVLQPKQVARLSARMQQLLGMFRLSSLIGLDQTSLLYLGTRLYFIQDIRWSPPTSATSTVDLPSVAWIRACRTATGGSCARTWKNKKKRRMGK